MGTDYQYESTNTLDFSGFESLLGGSGSDTFSIEESGSFAGEVNGGAGTDWISYADYDNSAELNLGTGTATGLGGTASIEGAIGSSPERQTGRYR